MTPVVLKYPLDPTGTSLNNLVQGEVHQMVRRKVRVVAPTHGAFFTESLRVVDTASNKVLVPSVQYIASEMYEEPTALFGKEICAIILITDTAVSDEVSIQYQAVGDKYSNSVKAIEQLIVALNLDDRPVSKDSIIDWPSEFPPSHHLHDVGDTYGWEYIANALQRLYSSIATGDAIKLDALYAYIDATAGGVSQEVVDSIADFINLAMAKHLADPDPHHQYLLRTEAESLSMAYVKKPVNLVPAPNAKDTGVVVTLDTTPFYSLYGIPQAGMDVRLSVNPGCVAPYITNQFVAGGNVTDFVHPELQQKTDYYWQVRYKDTDGVYSEWSDVSSFNTGFVFVNQPAIATPVNGSKVETNGMDLTSSAYGTTGMVDAHTTSDWEVWTGPDGTGAKVFSAYNVAAPSALDRITIPKNVLTNKTTYYPRVRHKGTRLPYSAWSGAKSFNLDFPLYPTVMGEAWGGGFYAGNINLADGLYAIILAPKATGETSLRMGSTNTSKIAAEDFKDSVSNTEKYRSVYPATTYAAAWVRALNLGGFTDWQVPARDVMQVVMNNLAMTKTSVAAYKSGGAQAMNYTYYWTSTAYNWVKVTEREVQEPDQPVYGYYDKGYTTFGNPTSNPTCGTGPDGERGYSVEPGSYTVHQTTDTSGNPFTYAAWWCEKSGYGIIGYEPGGTYTDTTYTDKYQVYVLTQAANVTYLDRTSTSPAVRAVRLLKILT